MTKNLQKPLIALTMMGFTALITLATKSVAQTAPSDLPQAIMCWNTTTETWGVAYLATIKKDGTAIYMHPSGKLSGTVNTKRIVEPPSSRPPAFDCYGKTVDELRAMGRLIEPQRLQ